ncbi:MAG: hypothetical protein VX642_07330 [Bdellovibrionota bacterium]|nr:hypothetical protein [Bdellovibrionota bacterium]
MNFIYSLLAIVGLCVSASAHFELGVYKGLTNNAEECSFEIKSVHFKNDLRHPLNERVIIDLQNYPNTEFRHLPIVNSSNASVRPKREILSAVFPHSSGASAFELFMNESGPFKLVYINDNYKTGVRETQVCESLSLQKNRP